MLMSLKINEYLFICLFACLQLVASSCSSNKHELLDDSSDYIFSFSKSDILDAQNFVDTYIDYIDQDGQLVSTSVNDRSSYIELRIQKLPFTANFTIRYELKESIEVDDERTYNFALGGNLFFYEYGHLERCQHILASKVNGRKVITLNGLDNVEGFLKQMTDSVYNYTLTVTQETLNTAK